MSYVLRKTLAATLGLQETSRASPPSCFGLDQTLAYARHPSYGEFMTLFSKTVAERTRPGQRQDVEEQGTRPIYTLKQNKPPDLPYQPTHSTPTAAPKASPE